MNVMFSAAYNQQRAATLEHRHRRGARQPIRGPGESVTTCAVVLAGSDGVWCINTAVKCICGDIVNRLRVGIHALVVFTTLHGYHTADAPCVLTEVFSVHVGSDYRESSITSRAAAHHQRPAGGRHCVLLRGVLGQAPRGAVNNALLQGGCCGFRTARDNVTIDSFLEQKAEI
jgi:hypothetical protein